MRILYAAKHDKGCNDNEGAIAYALNRLGHSVFKIHERRFGLTPNPKDYDLLLFQNWRNPPESLGSLPYPKVFWYFDRIDYGSDTALTSWTDYRVKWMNRVTPQVSLGFCTDGDWVRRDKTGKLFHLMQGADERYVRFCPAIPQKGILFTGSIYGRGEGRKSFVAEMKRHYRKRFIHRTSTFGKNLFDLVSSSEIIVAPDAPITNLYYSNRPYIMASLGGFVLHPYSETLAGHYEDGREMVFYRDREDLHEKIRYYLSHPQERLDVARAGYLRTRREHLYRHRLSVILSQVYKTLGDSNAQLESDGTTGLSIYPGGESSDRDV